ncbi:MAG: DUF4091 domain-containing protein [Bacteroidetes bacterium]|nr:DUF4091 domain-containing protein [Bacteroidota bacterium]
MDFKFGKTISPKIFIITAGIFILFLFFVLRDRSEILIKKNEITLNKLSLADKSVILSKYIFSNDLFSKNKGFDNFMQEIFGSGNENIFKQINNKFNNLFSKYNNVINNRNVQNFYKNYIKLLSETEKEQNIEMPTFGITPVHSIFKLDKNCGNLPEPVKKIEDYLFKGEWGSTQIIIVPFTNNIADNIEIIISGFPFPAKYIECFIGEYAFCNESYYRNKDEGWYADPLIPIDIDTTYQQTISFKIATAFSKIKQGETKSVWFNYFVPPSVKAGNYTIKAEIISKTSDKSEVHETNINLKIFDYTLPQTMHLKTAFSFDVGFFKHYYKIKKIPEKVQKDYYENILKYRLNPTSLYNNFNNTFPPINDWQWCIDHGANYFNLGYLSYIPDDSILKINKLKNTLDEKIKILKKNNLLNYAYIYGFDEVGENGYANLKTMTNQIRGTLKDIPFMCTVIPNKELAGSVDIWVPATSSINNNTKTFNPKEKLWWYVCCAQNKSPYPNFFIEYPAIDPRIIFWQCSKYNIDGFLYYMLNRWFFNDNFSELTNKDNPYIDQIKKGVRWPDIPWIGHSYRVQVGQRFFNGDGQLIYPGKNMKFCPSIRLINIRDGIEDYECFYQLKLLKKSFEKKGDKKNAELIDNFFTKAYNLVPSYKDYKNDPEELLEIRKEAGFLLQYLGKL